MTHLKFSLNNGVFLHFGKIKYSTNIVLKDTMEYDALLDTGASVSCMSVDIASVLFRIERNALIKKISPYKCKRKTYDYSNNEITGYNIVAKEVSLCGVRLENLF